MSVGVQFAPPMWIGTPRKMLLKDAEEAADLVLLPRLKAIGKQKL